jgi:hypothetical protein
MIMYECGLSEQNLGATIYQKYDIAILYIIICVYICHF